MAHDRQRGVGDFINARFPRGDSAQQAFRMLLNMYLQKGIPQAEAVARAAVSVRERHPGFRPVERHAPARLAAGVF